MKRTIYDKLKYLGLVVAVLILSTLKMGSSTDQVSFMEKSHLYFNAYQNRFDNLIFEYDQYLQQAIDEQQSPGAAVAIIYHGSILLLKGYGVKETGGDEEIDVHTVFRLGSVSKGFASVLSGMIEHDGFFKWDDPLIRHVPDFTITDTSYLNQLTVRHILSQSSGFPEHTYTDMLDAGVSYEKIKELLEGITIYYQPGTVYSYQNVVYSLIADVLQQVSGESYNDLIREKIFVPLKMEEASVDYQSMAANTNTALPHLRIQSGWKSRKLNDRYYSVAPASGINASASDLAQWLLALTGNFPLVVPQETLKDIAEINVQTPLLRTYRSSWKGLQNTAYGLGWRIFKFLDHNIVYHGGYVEGYRTEIAFDPAEDVGLVVLFNSNTSFASSCIPKFFEMFIQDQSYNQQAYLENSLISHPVASY